MSLAYTARKVLVGASLMTIAMSFVLDPSFATDVVAVPEPATTTLLALVGVAGLAAGFIRRRKK
jgi:small-conductance mechanosensitive channel